VRLLLDEMISPAIARELRARGHDVQAIKRDRPELESVADEELIRRMASDRRAIVTNDVADFAPLHDRLIAASEEHYGMLFTSDATMPRNNASVGRWVNVLEGFLREHGDEAAMRNRIGQLRGDS
jgi:predicted nuclease of predicted toxin-antitoxin system